LRFLHSISGSDSSFWMKWLCRWILLRNELIDFSLYWYIHRWYMVTFSSMRFEIQTAFRYRTYMTCFFFWEITWALFLLRPHLIFEWFWDMIFDLYIFLLFLLRPLYLMLVGLLRGIFPEALVWYSVNGISDCFVHAITFLSLIKVSQFPVSSWLYISSIS